MIAAAFVAFSVALLRQRGCLVSSIPSSVIFIFLKTVAVRGALGSQCPCLVKWFAQGQAILGVQSVKISSGFFFCCLFHTHPTTVLQRISSERRKETRLLCCVIYPTVLLCTLSSLYSICNRRDGTATILLYNALWKVKGLRLISGLLQPCCSGEWRKLYPPSTLYLFVCLDDLI